MSSDERTEIERRARALFDESVEALDAETRSRLNRARQAAVAEVRRARPHAWRQWLPLAAAASVALVAVLLWRAPDDGITSSARNGESVPAPEVVELLGAARDGDIVTEDPEFYAWLEVRGLPAPNGSG